MKEMVINEKVEIFINQVLVNHKYWLELGSKFHFEQEYFKNHIP